MKPKKLAALLTAAAIASSLYVPVQAEESRELVQLGELECWIEDGEYYTELDGEEYTVLVLGNDDDMVADLELIDQLNSTYGVTASNDYPSSTWPNQTNFKLYDGEYSEYVNLANGNYYSPAFLMSISGTDSTAGITVHYDDFLWTETRYLYTTVYYRQAGSWFSHNLDMGINILIYYHSFDVGDKYAAGAIDRMALKFDSAKSSSGAFTYYLKQLS